MRALIIGLLAVAGIVGLMALAFPGQLALLGEGGIARVVYLLCALLLVLGPFASLRTRQRTRGDPGLFTSALVWVSIFAVLVVLYRASWIWSGIAGLFNG